MAKKISQLTQATEVKSDDVTVIVQDGETKKLPLNMMVTKQDIENKKIAGLAKLDEIEATYENDTYTPTITVKNKSSVKTGEGDEVDYSANVMDGHVKSAILTGQTLVNLVTQKSGSFNGTRFLEIPLSRALKANTKYFVNFNVKESTLTQGVVCRLKYSGNTSFVGSLNSSGIITTNALEFDSIQFYIKNANDVANGLDAIVDDIMLIEYQEGMENRDIPYFEGMQSVKMPVLTTTGKNLLDPNYLKNQCLKIDPSSIYSNGEIVFNANVYHLKRLVDINFESNTQYAFNFKMKGNANTKLYIKVYYKDGSNTNHFPYINESIDVISGTTKKNATVDFITISYGSNNTDCILYLNECSLFKSDIVTSHEPYKSNILTVNEDVELRGIGDVRDTLDLMTGEVVSNFETLIIDGTENWYVSSNETDLTIRYRCDNIGVSILKDNICICDSYNVGGNTVGDDLVVAFNGTILTYRVLKSKFPTLKDFKKWLNDNPHTFIYQTEKSIKTVDLMPSGTHPSTTPYCWKNGHIQLSSSGLLPNLEYSVVTSRAGQINQNAAMIVKNDKRIFDLEILLAGGLVNTTYQALTLQNQVETGLSKVSLNSETEPDYLLYHMIMKLIEEKAYKLDDLTEKVNVFYLYEKLSDEQFETIYSALYPFVEDEIVEEPVVEELPEVVEDEVIM